MEALTLNSFGVSKRSGSAGISRQTFKVFKFSNSGWQPVSFKVTQSESKQHLADYISFGLSKLYGLLNILINHTFLTDGYLCLHQQLSGLTFNLFYLQIIIAGRRFEEKLTVFSCDRSG